MESIRINIHKQLSRDGLVPIIVYPSESAYDFHLHSCRNDMHNISTDKAYNISIYPDGCNMQVSLIEGIDEGYLQYSILTDISHKTVDGKRLIALLGELKKAYDSIASKDTKPSLNEKFQSEIARIHSELNKDTMPGYPMKLKAPKKDEDNALTYYMNYKSEGQVANLIKFPDQEFFALTRSIYLIPDSVHPAYPQNCKHIHSLVLRTFKIKSPQGYEYGQVKEGETVRVNLKGKEGMLPMTTDVRGDVLKPTPYGYFDTSTNTIRIDERTVKFYYELKFIVRYNGRNMRNCTVRYKGDQLMPDSNGCYLIKVYEDQVQDAGYIHFTGENMKDTDIQITPGIVKQQEYVFTPEPTHGLTRITLDFGDGRPIETSVDIGTNERLLNQLNNGKVKGYKVKKEGDQYRMMIPRKLTKSSKNTLRMMKFVAMVLFTLAAYALAAWLFTHQLPWPADKLLQKEEPSNKPQVVVTDENSNTFVESNIEKEEEDAGLIMDDTDQYTLEQNDAKYLSSHNIWRKDSIRSNKYRDIINTIYNGSISEIKMKGYNTKIIDNPWWEQVWTNIIVPNNVKKDIAREVFNTVIVNHNTLDVEKLYDELSKHIMNSVAYPASKTGAGAQRPANSEPIVPSTPLPQ